MEVIAMTEQQFEAIGVPQRDGGADLHTHTTASDGVCRPLENIRLAKEAGLEAIAITDHDTTAGLTEAAVEAGLVGIHLIPGVEISTVEQGIDIHVLGYYVNLEDTSFSGRLLELRQIRDVRNEMMVARLTELGIPLTMEEVIAELPNPLQEGETVGRPHMADALVRRGVVANMKEAFDRYLGKDGLAYVNPPRITPLTAATWIREAGGAVVLAHPGLYGDDVLVERIVREIQPDGIEVWHSDHTDADVSRYIEMADVCGLLKTAGSDFHGARQGKVFHGALGSRRIDMGTVESLREIADSRK
ncbi:PHP domain-containing protein [Paenibacillus sp. CAU 1523]|uniref:PHP domain-containing protein n=2 Tax=Paenibacillus arenosi TaxID=2774142 RepID=A0ABR9ASK4_9BACL|nr:PHP domain-containing protein [Paenibacillus arenosi]